MENKDEKLEKLIEEYENFKNQLDPALIVNGKIKESKLRLNDKIKFETLRATIQNHLAQLRDKDSAKYVFYFNNADIRELVEQALDDQREQERNFLYRHQIIPKYTEFSLFLVSIIVLLLLVFDSTIRKETFTPSEGLDSSMFSILLVLFPGFFLSIYHVFSKRIITRVEKQVMVFFAVAVNGIAGLYAGFYILEQSKGILLIFPIVNIISALLLLMALRMNLINYHFVSDEQAKRPEIILGAISVIIIFFTSTFIFKNYWAITFSISTAYATNINEMVNKFFFSKNPKLLKEKSPEERF